MKAYVETKTQAGDPSDLFSVDSCGVDLFRGRANQRNAYGALFGGQIVAQALAAADATVPDKVPHSLHAYFLRAGDCDASLDFRVERLRDGGRLAARRVEAFQEDRTILSLECSYRVKLPGFSHAVPTALSSAPSAGALDVGEIVRSDRPELNAHERFFTNIHPIEVRIPSEHGFFVRGDAPRRHYWLRVAGLAPDSSEAVQRCALTYLSDFLLAGTPLVPHTVALPSPQMLSTSVDHALWLHRPARCDDWLLFQTDSPSAEGGLNLARALIYDRAGTLVATAAQEALQTPIIAR